MADPTPPPPPPTRPPDNRPPTKPPERPGSRLCLTADEAFAAGWEDGANDAPLTDEEITRLVALHAPYLRPQLERVA